MLVNSPKIFYRHAFENKYAFPAFNVWNLEIAKAVAKAADLENAPILMQTFYGDLDYGGIEQLASMSQLVINQAKSPILLHLDHPTGLPMVLQCLKNGYRSVMFDGGSLALDENVRETGKAAEVAHALDAVIEGEIGQFGGEHQAGTVQECTPDDAERMFKESGIDMLAISVGSVHGEPSRLKLPLLKEIANRTRRTTGSSWRTGIDPEDLSNIVGNGSREGKHRGSCIRGVDIRLGRRSGSKISGFP